MKGTGVISAKGANGGNAPGNETVPSLAGRWELSLDKSSHDSIDARRYQQ